MRAISMIIGFGLRQVIGSDFVVEKVEDYFNDDSQILPNAIKVANERAWQALELAIIGNKSFHSKLTKLLTSKQIKMFSCQVEDILNLQGESFRQQCLLDLRNLQKQADLKGTEIVADCKSFDRFTEPERLINNAWEIVKQSANMLKQQGFISLSQLLGYRPPNGPPLLIAAFSYFLRHEIVNDSKLSQEFNFTLLQRISREQLQGFNALQDAIQNFGNEFETIMGQVSNQITQVEETVKESHSKILNLERRNQEIYQILIAVQEQLAKLQKQSNNSSETQEHLEEQAIKKVLPRFQPKLSENQQRKLPAFLLQELKKKPEPEPNNTKAKYNLKLPNWLLKSPDINSNHPELREQAVEKTDNQKIHWYQKPITTNHSEQQDKTTAIVNITIEPSDSGCEVINSSGDSGSGTYMLNQTITLVSKPKTGWVFSHWSGDITNNNKPTIVLTINMDKNITAHFVQKPSYILGAAFR